MVFKKLVKALRDMRSELPFWYSRLEIANAIGVSKSPTLIKYLEQFVDEGWLDRRTVVNARGLQQFEYCISQSNRAWELDQEEENA